MEPAQRPVAAGIGPLDRCRSGNAGGRGKGALGAHGTRIPFGGDIAGANLDVLLGSAGLNRNQTFIAASLNHLPERGGGEPTLAELFSPEGAYPDSIAIIRDTLIAAGPRLVVALGNVAARVVAAAWSLPPGAHRHTRPDGPAPIRLDAQRHDQPRGSGTA